MARDLTSPEFGNEYDPTGVETFDSIYDDFARLRATCPVAHSSAFGGFWALSKYDDVARVLAEPRMFITSVRNVVPGSSTTGRRPPLHLDLPDHTPYRRAIDRALSPARVAVIEPATRRIAGELAQALVERGEADLVEHFSGPMPVHVFAEWMGLSRIQVDALWLTSRAYVEAWEKFDKPAVLAAGLQLEQMARELIAERKRAPLDPAVDPTSSLLLARDANGEPFADELLMGCIRQVLVVGLVAPPILIGSMAVHLSRDLELQEQLRTHPDLIPEATEEFLRLYTPYRGFARTTKEEVEIAGKKICPGEPMAIMYASANRDEAVFSNADQFKLGRKNLKEHLAFGRGPHRCAGVALARMQLQIALQELLGRTRHFEVSGPIKMSGMPEVGPIAVPMKFVAR